MVHQNFTLLIVDDSPIVRQWLVKIIGQIPGIRLIGEAASVAEARLVVQCFHPEIIVLDLNLPDGAGFMVLDETKAISPETKVIILTNYPQAQHRARAAAAGADYFFDKSMEFENVGRVLKLLVEERCST